MSSIIPQNTLLEHRFNRRNQRLCFATQTPWETNDLEPFLRSSILTKKSGLQKENLGPKILKRDSHRKTRTLKFVSKDSNHKI